MKRKGFTLLEVLLSVFILLILLGLSVISYAYFSKSSELASSSANLSASLREAQSRAFLGVSEQFWGIHLETGKYVLFKGEIYNSNDPENQVNPLSSGIYLSWNLSPSVSEIIFEKLNGLPRVVGIITVVGPFNQTKTISINEVGKIEEQ